MNDANLTAQARAKNIKLLSLDVDGVFTDGRLYLSGQGEDIKCFNILDGLGVKLLQASGVDVAIISGRRSDPLALRAKSLGIRYFYPGREDKLNALSELLIKTGLQPGQVAHLGDDLPDLPVMLNVGLAMAVANAYSLVKEKAHWQATLRGGEGAVREACEFIMKSQGTLTAAHQTYLNQQLASLD